MKTVTQEIQEAYKMYSAQHFQHWWYVNKDRLIETEKQQHEQTSIHITNVLMDALDNPKGGKFSGEYEFNKYWDETFNNQ